MRIAIIGAGLAGTAAAYVLKQYVSDIKIYDTEKEIASGASGNVLGLVNPRLSAFRTPESDYFTSALSLAQRTFSAMDGVDWNRCGALHLMTDEKKAKRFPQTLENWGWPEEHMRLVSAEEASVLAGVELRHEALYVPGSANVSPRKLCRVYVGGVDVELGTHVESLSDMEADIIILACGIGVKMFDETAFLPLGSVRGQVTTIEHAGLTGLKTNLCYGGYCTPAINGAHVVGATFQRWLDHSDIRPEDDSDNLDNLSGVLPFDLKDAEVKDHRASVRTTSKDHFPVVGRVPGHENLYVSCGHGSHGILSSLAGAHLLADMILDRPRSLALATIHSLSPARFMTP